VRIGAERALMEMGLRDWVRRLRGFGLRGLRGLEVWWGKEEKLENNWERDKEEAISGWSIGDEKQEKRGGDCGFAVLRWVCRCCDENTGKGQKACGVRNLI
jgi:hypothetical protein